MSLVVAIKNKDRFILGADKQASGWNSKSHKATKVWCAEYENCCIGSVGTLRAAQIIQYIKGLLDGIGFGKKEINEEYIHLSLTRTIYETLKAHGVIAEQMDQPFSLPNEFLIAYKDRCWLIGQDLSVEEVDNFIAMGSGQEVAIGSIETSMLYEEKNPYRIITTAIDVAAEHTLYVDHEVEFVETVSKPRDVLDKLEALGYDLPKEYKNKKVLDKIAAGELEEAAEEAKKLLAKAEEKQKAEIKEEIVKELKEEKEEKPKLEKKKIVKKAKVNKEEKDQ